MSATPPSSSTLGISSSEAKPRVSPGSANAHFSLSTSGTPTNTAAASTASPPESNYISYHHDLSINEIQEDMRMVDVDLNDYATRVPNQMEEASKTLNSLAGSLFPSKDGPAEGPTETDVQQDLIELKENVVKLGLQILSEPNPKPPYTSKSNPNRNHSTNDSTHRKQKIIFRDEVPNLCKNEMLARSSEFKDFKELYNGLGNKQKLCLLCFSVFPEKAIIKKRFMFYWWTAEGFVAPAKGSEQTAEELANKVFSELMAKGFIEPFSEKRNLAGWVNKCQIHPFVRAAVITLAIRAKFFDFDAEGKPMGKFSSSYRACLLAGETLTESEGMDNVHMLFNVDETILNFKMPGLFSTMKNINLLCLGKWQASQMHHIEVGDTKFLEGLKYMKHLKFLSLQGISHIKDLPTSVSNLTKLMILDIRACPNLEKIPGEIGFLKSLTHLDMSECYFLVNMPKQISMLLQLEVLKGFIVGTSEGKDQDDSCTLGHLVVLSKLRKLGIFTSKKSFPSHNELLDLNRLEKLHTLRIEWGKETQTNSGLPEDAIPEDASPGLPSRLEKLDLECLPCLDAPTWLMNKKLKSLEKLYIRGGMLRDLGQFGFQEKGEWAVEILRLKFLNNLEMDWRELMKLFPKLKYLENVRCPKLTFFPCDGHGVWMKKPAKSN